MSSAVPYRSIDPQIGTSPHPYAFSGFLRSAEAFPNRPALEVPGAVLTYAELRARAQSLAITLRKHQTGDDPPVTAVFADRSVTAFAGVLGILLRGHGYVPLNHSFPVERTIGTLERCGCRAMIVDEVSAPQLEEVLGRATRSLTVILPWSEDVSELAQKLPRHRFLGARDLEPADGWTMPDVSEDGIAYVLFTSGSTGTPKGVTVAHRNVGHYVDFMRQRYGLNENDRFSQTADLTFDISVSDMFLAWSCGGCLCCPTRRTLLSPGSYIKNSALTVWFSVPSMGIFLKRFGALKPGSYPSLRVTLFCGEPLPNDIAAAWQQAAPNSVVDNLYGPTEVTVACTYYRWFAEQAERESFRGVVPIGEPYERMEALIADEHLREVPLGSNGELLMSGPQTALGYWNEPEKTAAAFVTIGEKTYYRTGDIVRRDPGRPMVYIGRVDHQVKILGHRVELGEIEAAARRVAALEGVIAIAWPVTPSGAGGIELFVEAESCDAEAIIAALRNLLPHYMVPRNVHAVPKFPLNANGKYDRKALTARLTERQ